MILLGRCLAGALSTTAYGHIIAAKVRFAPILRRDSERWRLFVNFIGRPTTDTWPKEWHTVMGEVIEAFRLDIDGIHGLSHWSKVLVNGLRLSETTGANNKVVIAFALLHDCQRDNDGYDPNHGLRGAEFGSLLRHKMPSISDLEFELFYQAAKDHSDGYVEADVTIQTCWDADRLDLFRVGIRPDPQYLCTEVAKQPHIIEWAVSRSKSPHLVANW